MGRAGGGRLLRSSRPWKRAQLLSVYTGPTSSRPIASDGSLFTINVTGGGYPARSSGSRGRLRSILFATNPASALTITSQPRQAHFNTTQINIGRINVKSGQLGSIEAGAANLLGPMSPLKGSVSSIEFASIGRNATVDVRGDLGGLRRASVGLGPTGRIHVGGNLNGSMGGSINLDGGQFVVDNDATGTFSPANLIVQRGGILSVRTRPDRRVQPQRRDPGQEQRPDPDRSRPGRLAPWDAA